MNDIATYLTATIGRLAQAVIAFVAVQLRAPETVWIGAQAYNAIPQPNQPKPIPAETWHHLTHRLARLAQRLRALFIRYQTNTLPPPRPSRAGTPSNRHPQPHLPAARGWINARIPAAAPCAGTIEYLLQTPEMQAFVTAAPQAGRLLRPLAHMLGLTLPDYLHLPPRPKPSFSPLALGRGEPEGGSSATAPLNDPTPDRPLQPEIRAAARAWKKYDR